MRHLLGLDRDLGRGDFGRLRLRRRRRRRLRRRCVRSPHADQAHGRLHQRLVLLGEQRGREQQREREQQQQRAPDEHVGAAALGALRLLVVVRVPVTWFG